MQHGPSSFRREPRPAWVLCLLGLFLGTIPILPAAEPEEAGKLFLAGDYPGCIQMAGKAMADDDSGEEWRLLLAQAFMAVGQYTNAHAVISTNLERYSSSVRLRLLARDVYLLNGRPEEAKGFLTEIYTLWRSRGWAYQDGPNLVAMGRTALLLGNDPKLVLEQFYDRARKRDPAQREPYLASGQLALDKGDYDLAAKTFANGLKKFPDDPDFHFGLAQAYAPSDRKEMLASLNSALEANTNHVGSHLLLADHLIDGEEYPAAEKTLAKALSVNPWQPEAWAYRTVLAHLRNEAKGEAAARATALKFWSRNPAVDHLIGRKLSLKYRFAEGAACQRRALVFDPKYLPARIQLSQDLLRLGEETEGWELAEAVHAEDAYDVSAYNLTTLHENMNRFATLTNRDFVVRLATNEAAIYGEAVLALLQRARDTLTRKYWPDLASPTIVEIFPEPKDFGVRTFGMPGNPGYLGVCFGQVITANSPASQGVHPANWQAVLWHEFCHVVTLQMTRNKMPRWLSEGISVYEEKQENPTWGQEMNPRYREMILGKDFTPLSQLSAAFLAPKTEQHLQFAYYESSLAVEFLVHRFGLESLKSILRDLADGAEINAAIASRTAPMETLEKDFKAFARDRAEKLAPGLKFEKPKVESIAKIQEDMPASALNNFTLLNRQARKLLQAKKWEEAKAPLEKLIRVYPGNTEGENPYELLAGVHRHLGETNLEREVLSRLAARDADTVEVFQRLMDLGSQAADWPAVATNAARYLAVNPLRPQPYRYLAQASEALGRTQDAIRAGQTLLLLDPPDPAAAHYQLARLLHQTGDPGARRHLLQALEEAPRFREGHRLLLAMAGGAGGSSTNAPASARPGSPEGTGRGPTPPAK